MTSVVHIAGMSVQIGLLLRQRCAWCSYTLVNHDLSHDQSRPKIWLTGALVDVDGDTATQVVEHLEGHGPRSIEMVPREIPPNACCLHNSPADTAATRARFTTVLIADNAPIGFELVKSLGYHDVTTLVVSSPLDLHGVMLAPDFEIVDETNRMPSRHRDKIIELLGRGLRQNRSTTGNHGDQAPAQRGEG